MSHTRSLFVFRQDLRLQDNTGLLEAIHSSKEVVPVFIFDETVLSRFPENDSRAGFLVDAIVELDKELRARGSHLSVYYGDPKKIIPELIVEHKAEALYYNKSYGSGSLTRDAFIQDRCKKNQIHLSSHDDFFLVPIDAVPQRKVFTPFFKLWQKELATKEIVVHKAPNQIKSPRIHIPNIESVLKKLSYTKNTIRNTTTAHDRLHNFDFSRYDETRNFPAIDGSSRLSPYIRFGLISIREVYKAAKKDSSGQENVFISELAWREFWNHIMFYFPETRAIEFLEKRRKLAWDNNEKYFEARKEGKTGYPLVDAGMRQLKAENRMHNRVRMVVASFLTKDLMIDWRRGEEHFANYLLDYDENVNIGNWQRGASVGADPKPLRIFSPLLQSERFDPQCEYIKKWIPELRDIDPKKIHNPLENDLGYAKPIVDHYERSKKAKAMYAKE